MSETSSFSKDLKGEQMQTIEERHGEWEKIIEEQKTSGLSKAAYCKPKGISENRFYYYLDKLVRRETRANVKNFVPVEIKDTTFVRLPAEAMELRLILKNGIECVQPEGISGRRIKEVIEVLVQC